MHFLIHDKKVLKPFETSLFRGWVAADDIKIADEKPKFEWKGSKIPFELWAEVVCFLRWTQKEFKEEAMVTFFYHETEKKWAAWAFPQEPNGMTIKLLPNTELYKEDRKRFGKGWIQAGSIHHHCTMKAFQSGVDTADEIDRDGIHFTIGEMENNVLDLHVRQVFGGVQSDTKATDWIDYPQYLKDAPDYLRDDFHSFCIRAVRGVPHPKEWEDRIMEKEVVNTSNFHMGGVAVHHHTSRAWEQGSTNVNVTDKTERKSESTAGASYTPGTATNVVHTGRKLKHLKHLQLKPDDRRVIARASVKNSDPSWVATQRAKINEVINRLSLNYSEAWSLLTDYPDSSWTQEDVTMRSELNRELNKEGVAPLFAEGLLYNMLKS